VVLETVLLEGVLPVGLAVVTGVVVTGVVVTGVAELGDVLVAGLVVALDAADPVAVALVPLLTEDAEEGNAWASWLSPEEMALVGLVVACELAACCRATDTASNSAERNCVSA
jgi:hypothetical protein